MRAEEPHLPARPAPVQASSAPSRPNSLRMRPDLTWKRLSSEPTCSTSMAEPGSMEVTEPQAPGEAQKSGVRPADRHGLLKHSREFLDFFWDIAKPQQETRLEATEKLLEYLRAKPKVWWRDLGQEQQRSRQVAAGLGSRGREPGRPK